MPLLQQQLSFMRPSNKESRESMEYRDFNDYELLSYIGEKNEDALEILYKKYQPLIINTATRLYNQAKRKSGLELSDLVQEGMLGFSDAIQHYDDKNGTLFFTYAKTCVERRILSTIIASQRLKHKILNESISFNFEAQHQEQADIDILLSDNSMNPELLLISDEEEKELQLKIYSHLSDQERQILELKVNGFTYEEIAQLLDLSKKKVDNTIQRIRNKLRKMTNK